MKIRYHSSHFSVRNFPHLSRGWRTLDFTEEELLTATYTVGRANKWSVLRHGVYSLYEMIYRTAMVEANLFENADEFLEKSPAYIALDPSEKGAVSYFMGMTFTKLLSEKLLGIPFIMHLEVYEDVITRRVGRIVYGRGKSRPDFIAMDNDLNWYVFESKGRTNGLPDDVLVKAKRQTRMIRTIGGDAPRLKVALATYFQNDIIRAKWEDPDGFNEKRFLDLDEIKPIDFIRKYYAPFFELTKLRTFIEEDKKYIIVPVEQLGLVIKIPRVIEKIYSPDLTTTQLKEILKSIRPKNLKKTELITQGNDGIIFEFNQSWKGRFRKSFEKN